MTEEEIKKLVELQRSYFYTGATRPVKTRIEHLKKLKDWVTAHEEDINKALGEDLGKSSFESYMCETGLVLNELTHMIRNVDEYAEEQDVHTPMSQFAARSYKKPVPYGIVLVMSPWNYPFLLSIEPLIDALAAGNTVTSSQVPTLLPRQRSFRLWYRNVLNRNLSLLSPAVGMKIPTF